MSVKSAIRVMEILELLANHPEGLTVKEISEALSFPQSSTFNLMQSMYDQSYVKQDPFKRYKLGPKLIEIGMRTLESIDLHSESQPFLMELMKKTEETVFLAILSETEIIYVSKIPSNRSIQTSAQIGLRKPLYSTGLGKAFLAFMPKEEREQILEQITLTPFTAKTITNRKQLEEQLDFFAKIGYSIDDEEGEEGLYCIACPVFDASHKVAAAISVAGPKERMLARRDFIVEQTKLTANKISSSIGAYSIEK
ncbi:IclR family transcriptional regulator [Fictibacillus sp. Mic-4]|uniref:IclR family transcriptional regulator n=1 Tax=Fictibacillus sp. Mic-4 TaxID=3132826 RepID=UPI003CEF7A09